MLSQSMVIKNITQFFSPSILGVVNMDVKVTNNNYTVKVNTDYRQQFSKVIKKGCAVFRWPVDIQEHSLRGGIQLKSHIFKRSKISIRYLLALEGIIKQKGNSSSLCTLASLIKLKLGGVDLIRSAALLFWSNQVSVKNIKSRLCPIIKLLFKNVFPAQDLTFNKASFSVLKHYLPS